MMRATNREIEIHNVVIESLSGISALNWSNKGEPRCAYQLEELRIQGYTWNKHYSPFSDQENLSIPNGIAVYPPWKPTPEEQTTEGQLTVPSKWKPERCLRPVGSQTRRSETAWCTLEQRRRRQNPDHLPCSDYQCNKERCPRKNCKDLRSPRTSITHYSGGKNTIQRSVWNPNSMGPKTSPGTRNQLANRRNQSFREDIGTKKHCPSPRSDH